MPCNYAQPWFRKRCGECWTWSVSAPLAAAADSFYASTDRRRTLVDPLSSYTCLFVLPIFAVWLPASLKDRKTSKRAPSKGAAGSRSVTCFLDVTKMKDIDGFRRERCKEFKVFDETGIRKTCFYKSSKEYWKAPHKYDDFRHCSGKLRRGSFSCPSSFRLLWPAPF